jgi:hypothetical protein
MAGDMTNSQGAGSYPVQVDCVVSESPNRFWAIPLIGLLAKLIILIPHIVILYLLGIVVALLQLILWIPILFTGAYPTWGYTLVGGVIGWTARVSAYTYGLTDLYPPFSLQSPTEPAPAAKVQAFPVTYSVHAAATAARWPAIPLIGLLIKLIILIPHLVIIYALNIAVTLAMLVIWAWVLFAGVYPGWARTLVVGYLRWSIRMQSYLYGLTDAYPPFQMGN